MGKSKRRGGDMWQDIARAIKQPFISTGADRKVGDWLENNLKIPRNVIDSGAKIASDIIGGRRKGRKGHSKGRKAHKRR
jgi:hypothetical protein